MDANADAEADADDVKPTALPESLVESSRVEFVVSAADSDCARSNVLSAARHNVK